MEGNFQSGTLFTRDYLTDAIRAEAEYEDLDLTALSEMLSKTFGEFPTDQSPSEAKTEDDLIWRVLVALGWEHSERQVNLAPKGRDNIPDGLLFLDEQAKVQANMHVEHWKRYEHGVVVVESKRWGRPLDRGLRKKDEETAPSTQMLRYLRRVDDLTNGDLRWGFLTNGAVWRLYYQGARSVSEQFFEIDLASILRARGDLLDADESKEGQAERDHWLRVFVLMFRRKSFAPSTTDPRTFHVRALEEGRFYEERVAKNLSDMVFQTVFPSLAKAIAADKPEASLDDVRHAALILLYRLLFLLYAEDRNLLPVRDERYDDYGLRDKVRGDVGRRKDQNDTFSDLQDRYWSVIDGLSRAIDKGDTSIGLPPYNGGLFNRKATPLLDGIHIPDSVMAEVIDLLSYECQGGQRRYINYRDLSVQQLGSIYERLLEFEIKPDPEEGLVVRPNLFARKSSGSYYTPDELVGLILKETLEPLIEDKLSAFRNKVAELADAQIEEDDKISQLRALDPAEALLTLRICDPAMGSGHFLVNLVDYLADTVIETLAEVTSIVDWAEEPYTSPLAERIADIRTTIKANADANNWTVDLEQLDDRHIIRRMVLKRCVYGVDKNMMAVELAKVSLWLHTFTVGAPLSFLDHHLRCGDSLFGEGVGRILERLEKGGHAAFIGDEVKKAVGSASAMNTIENLTDAEIAEAHRSADIFDGILKMTDPLNVFMQTLHAIDWLDLKSEKRQSGSAATETDLGAVRSWLDGNYGDPVAIATGKAKLPEHADRFAEILKKARTLIEEERFLNWEVAFPGVWRQWDGDRTGGFDAIVGNPPWDRIRLQEVEWFGLRDRRIAMAARASDRKRMIAQLQANSDPLFADYTKAKSRAEGMAAMARKVGDYPLLSGGDINLYSLFVERAMALLADGGVMGLLTPSGIASDKTASKFFKGVATTGRLKALFDFENKKIFFPDVHASFKFCAFIASRTLSFSAAKCAFYMHDVAEVDDPDRCFPLTADDFARVNPNTGTAPILRSRRDADLTRAIYSRVPVLVDRSGDEAISAWPVKYDTMFHMTNDSGLFRTKTELEGQEGAWHVGGNIWESGEGKWVPLYVGRMIHQFDHRAASVEVNAENVHNAALSGDVSDEQKADPSFVPKPQYWVLDRETTFPSDLGYMVGFRDIARATDVRTMIASMVPRSGVGNTAPLITPRQIGEYRESSVLLLGNLNSIILDYVLRQKAQSTHVNWYIVEQLPVLAPTQYARSFGLKTAAEIIKPAVLELTYTAHDMAPFARDMGYLDDKGDVLPPFTWDEARRLRLRAKLDAVFFHLYGIFDPDNREQSRDDIRYIYSTFPIVERQEMRDHGRYLSRDLALAYCNTLAAGQPDAEPEV
jgi:hypothetical protein